ncbi:MAG: 1-acyl-sn-glycerol-3-phosphate acyltransferase [Chloroflexi bacterium]|nr:1-acyl-sn-glycerol-3-phosphate acyltransferase [Chloroflexota bacterium]
MSRCEIDGAEFIPSAGPAIVAINHIGFLDALLVGIGLPRIPEGLVIDYMFDVPVIRRMLRLYGAVSFKRDSVPRRALDYALAALAEGRVIVLPPQEGVTFGPLGRPKLGVAYLACKSGAPVVPAAITGTERVSALWYPDEQRVQFTGLRTLLFRRLKLRLRFGPPYYPPPLDGGWKDQRLTIESATEEIVRRIAALLPREYRGVYGEVVRQ